MPCTILNVAVDTISRSDIVKKINTFIASGHTHHIITANSIMLMHAFKDPGLARTFKKASLVSADSIGICWAARFLREPMPPLFPGIDLMAHCLACADKNAFAIYLIGSKERSLRKAIQNIQRTYPHLHVAGSHHGYFTPDEEHAIIDEIGRLKPAFIFVGLDTPRQEMWISQTIPKVPSTVIIGVGGSFDILSGVLLRAPTIARDLHIEWLFRMLQQPWRIWRLRYLLHFVFLVLLQKFRLLKHA